MSGFRGFDPKPLGDITAEDAEDEFPGSTSRLYSVLHPLWRYEFETDITSRSYSDWISDLVNLDFMSVDGVLHVDVNVNGVIYNYVWDEKIKSWSEDRSV